jgi:hypothetical protein
LNWIEKMGVAFFHQFLAMESAFPSASTLTVPRSFERQDDETLSTEPGAVAHFNELL